MRQQCSGFSSLSGRTMRPWYLLFSHDSFFSSSQPRFGQKLEHQDDIQTTYEIWLASRSIPGEYSGFLVPGAQRRLSCRNAQLAYQVLVNNAFAFFKPLWGHHPTRTALMMASHLLRSLFPAFRGYSQALIIDEIQSLIASEVFSWSRLLCLIGTEITRRYLEGLLEAFATHNESIVIGSAKFLVEYQQLKHRVRLDDPTLADPITRDLLHEADLFARSFNGGGFGSISPLDFLQIITLFTEILSHLFLIASITNSYVHAGIFIFSLFSVALPALLPASSFSHGQPDSLFTPREARAADRRERMRNWAFSDAYRPEVQLFGLEDWILKSWACAWKVVFESEKNQNQTHLFVPGVTFSDLFYAFQNIPFLLLLKSSSATLGSMTLYRSSIHSVIFGVRRLLMTVKMAFQSLFLMAAFCASAEIQPKLQPKHEDRVAYRSVPGGVSIQARNISYTYPGCSEPALKDVSFTLNAGETLAIVGYNGSGKSTLAKILLRIIDFDQGELLINGIDIRRYEPAEYHRHLSAVFQGFAKFNSTLRENIGIGSVSDIKTRCSIEAAVNLARADGIVNSLPQGIQTILECPGFESIPYTNNLEYSSSPHGLSGGEWQRIALARAFMRANDPAIDLLVFDEPTSSLDAKAQKEIFDTIHNISHSPDGKGTRTVVFITHRLSTARRADRVAMMENGTISEYGTHGDLLRRKGAYAALYNQAI